MPIFTGSPTMWKGANIIQFGHVAILLMNVFDRSVFCNNLSTERVIAMVTIHQLQGTHVEVWPYVCPAT